MANYPKILMTTRGLSLISEANATNQALIFTKIMLGDGDIGGDSIRNLTALKNPKMELTLSGGTNLGNGQLQIRASCSNAGLNTGFFAREVGVYAKVGTSGNEKLIAYTNGGNFVDYIPDKSTPIDSQIFKIDIVVGDVENLTVQVKDETFLTQAELDEHNRNAGAHENRFSLYEKIGSLGKDVINKLALTTTIPAISALQKNSWFGQLLKMVLTASGVKYHIADNGYVCLGSFFGGLIIQWGRLSSIEGFTKASISLPLTVPDKRVTVLVSPEATTSDGRVSPISAQGFNDHIEINLGTSLSINWCTICH